MSEHSDQEIDLRPYITAVFSKWYWIVGLGLLAGILAFVATSLLATPVYEATALVSITEPRQRVQFDPRIVSVEENQPLKAYPEIAVSDELLATLQAQLPEAGALSLSRLRSILKASPGSDPSLLRLTARNEDPETASIIANGWAELFVVWANSTYGDSSEEQLVFFEQRLEDASADLQKAEESLVEYQAENLSAILDNELQALAKTHADLLAKEGEIRLISQDIESLLAHSGENPNAAGDQFSTLILKLRAFGGPPGDGEVTFPWHLQVNTDSFANDEDDLQEQLLNLQGSLAVQVEQTSAALTEIEPKILAVQREKQEANATESLMLRQVELAEDTQTALARTVEEKRITSQDADTGVSLVSRSAVPAFPLADRQLISVLAAVAGATLFAALIIILVTWWRTD